MGYIFLVLSKHTLRKILRDDKVISVKLYSTSRKKKNISSTLKIYLLDQCLEKLSLLTIELNDYKHYGIFT